MVAIAPYFTLGTRPWGRPLLILRQKRAWKPNTIRQCDRWASNGSNKVSSSLRCHWLIDPDSILELGLFVLCIVTISESHGNSSRSEMPCKIILKSCKLKSIEARGKLLGGYRILDVEVGGGGVRSFRLHNETIPNSCIICVTKTGSSNLDLGLELVRRGNAAGVDGGGCGRILYLAFKATPFISHKLHSNLDHELRTLLVGL